MMAKMVGAIAMPPFVRRRKPELIALVLVTLGSLLSATLATYHSGDASFNHLGDGQVKNALGSLGASMADIL